MKISDLGKKGPVKKAGSSGNSGSAKGVGKAGSGQSAVSAGQKAGVSVTGTEGYTASAEANGMARAEKVAEVKLVVDNGDYEPDSLKTAEKIIDHLTDYSLA